MLFFQGECLGRLKDFEWDKVQFDKMQQKKEKGCLPKHNNRLKTHDNQEKWENHFIKLPMKLEWMNWCYPEIQTQLKTNKHKLGNHLKVFLVVHNHFFNLRLKTVSFKLYSQSF